MEMNYRPLDMMTCLCEVIFLPIFFKKDKKFYKFSVPCNKANITVSVRIQYELSQNKTFIDHYAFVETFHCYAHIGYQCCR